MRTQFVNLTYPPDVATIAVNETTESVPMPTARGCGVSLLVSDERDSTGRIGFVPSGIMGEVKTPVLTDDNVAAWVRDAVEQELRVLGYPVLDGHLRGGTEVLEIAIEDLEASCVYTCRAKVSFTARRRRDSREGQAVEFTGDASKHPWFSRREASLDVALPAALQKAIQEMIVSFGMGDRSACTHKDRYN